MRTGAAAGHAGYFHETALYGSDDEFVDVVRPFLREGVDAGEPTIVACSDHNASLLRRALDCDRIRFVAGSGQYAQPGSTISSSLKLFRDLVDAGAPQIRLVGDVPHAGTGADWHGWRRYEAAVNVTFEEFPLWGLCPYDVRTAPESVLEDVACTHPFVATADGGHHRNPSYVEPVELLDRFDGAAARPDLGPPTLRLTGPGPREARHALTACARDALAPQDLEDLAIVTAELVANAHRHGAPPVSVEAWLSPGRILVSVSDHGSGPSDPLAGLVPPRRELPGGRGLWLAHQLCTELRMIRSAGFEVLFSIGRPVLASYAPA